MAVFRIERTRDYTVMSNHHLRNGKLSLKAKGLLSMMLSLPEDWNYTTRGLAAICKEGVDAIGGALRELETVLHVVQKDGEAASASIVLYHARAPRHLPENLSGRYKSISHFLLLLYVPWTPGCPVLHHGRYKIFHHLPLQFVGGQ